MAKICMVAYTRYLTDARVRREAEALAERGDTVDVLCLQSDDHPDRFTCSGVRLIALPSAKYSGSSIVRYLWVYGWFCVQVFFRLTVMHLKHRYDVIQVHTMPDFIVFPALVPRILGARIILDVHDLMPELYESKFGLPKSHRLIRLITWVERRSVAFAHRAIAVHEPHLDALVSHGNPRDKFAIVINLPDPKVFSCRVGAAAPRNDALRLIYHGTVAERYGLRVALRAVQRLKAEVDDLHFTVAGFGEDMPYLEALAEALGITGCVTFQGWVPHESLCAVLATADIGLVPILYDGFTRYMLPTKLMEYVMLGMPAVCSRTETIETYFDDSMVQFVEPGSVDDLVEKLLDLYHNPEKRQQLAANAQAFNRKYNWPAQKQDYYHLIDSLCRQPVFNNQPRHVGKE